MARFVQNHSNILFIHSLWLAIRTRAHIEFEPLRAIHWKEDTSSTFHSLNKPRLVSSLLKTNGSNPAPANSRTITPRQNVRGVGPTANPPTGRRRKLFHDPTRRKMQTEARDTSRLSTKASHSHLRKSLNKRRLALVLMVNDGAADNDELTAVASIWALGRQEKSTVACRGWTMNVCGAECRGVGERAPTTELEENKR